MSTLQALCEAAEMSVELPVSTNQSTSSSTATQKANVEGGAPQKHSTQNQREETSVVSRAAPFQSKMISHEVPVQSYVKADARDTDSPTFASSERRDASSPLIHVLPSIDSTSEMNTMALDAPKSVAANTKGSSNKGGKTLRKRGWVKKSWDERLMELKAYKAVHGDCNVPTLSKTNPSLGMCQIVFDALLCYPDMTYSILCATRALGS